MTYIVTILGGLGVFLLGMKLLSDNLRDAAGDALRVLLAKFTSGPLSSVSTGAIFTALVQSSSATTLASIGFVSAGLLTFAQAVGVIFGANLGTTATSWLVATLGLRVSISAFAYPMVGLGALASLLLKGRTGHFGAAIAGFGLIFVGIDILQVGMADLAARIDLSGLSGEGLGGQLVLVGIGFIMTVLMQSSSAAIAATLTALDAGAVDMPQAAALVIGQAVGTTATAALAAIGASLAARRTAAAHIVFNVITAVLALAVLPLFLMGHSAAYEAGFTVSDAIAIAIFHTGFKVLGVVVLLPVLDPFSRLVSRIIPGTEPQYAAGLDRRAAAIPAVALEAARNAQRDMYHGLVNYIEQGLDKPDNIPRMRDELDALAIGLARCREFLDHVRTDPDQESEQQRHLAILHTMDHLERLHSGLDVPSKHFRKLSEADALVAARQMLERAVEHGNALSSESDTARSLESISYDLAGERRRRRHDLLRSAVEGDPPPTELDALLRSLLWCDQLVFHLWRSSYYLEGGLFVADAVPPEPS